MVISKKKVTSVKNPMNLQKVPIISTPRRQATPFRILDFVIIINVLKSNLVSRSSKSNCQWTLPEVRPPPHLSLVRSTHTTWQHRSYIIQLSRTMIISEINIIYYIVLVILSSTLENSKITHLLGTVFRRDLPSRIKWYTTRSSRSQFTRVSRVVLRVLDALYYQ